MYAQFYADNPDGLSTFNWHPNKPGTLARSERRSGWGPGVMNVQMFMHTKLGDRASIQSYLEQKEPLERGEA